MNHSNLSEAPFVVVSDWIVGSAERQEATVEATQAAWRQLGWPDGLLRVNLLASLDGTHMVNYGVWGAVEAYEAFVRDHRKEFAAIVDRAVPDIKRVAAVPYRVYRSRSRAVEGEWPGCVVIVSVRFDGPDGERQRRWVDTVFESLASEPELPPGGISGKFHLSEDGTSVLNYAEWTSAEAHMAALNTLGSKVRNFPGVVAQGFKRYRPASLMVEGTAV